MVQEQVEVVVGGKSYRLTCDAGEAPILQEAARLLDAHLARCSAAGLTGEKRALWAAFEIATEWVRWQRQRGLDLPALERRITAMTEQLNGWLAKSGAGK